MKKILIIEDNAKFIYFKNRKVRTPVTLLVSTPELKALKIAMKMADVQKWKIIEYAKKKNKAIDYDIYNIGDDVIIEDLDEDLTILEKLMKDGDDKE